MEMPSGAQKHVDCFDKRYQMLLRDIFNFRQTTFSVNLNHDLMVGINYNINLTMSYYLSCAYPQHEGDERVITRKCN